MKTLSANLLASSQQITKATPFLWLCEAISDLTVAERTLFRLVNAPEQIVFNGQTYYPASFKVSPIPADGEGNLPALDFQLFDVLQQARVHLNVGDGFMGLPVSLTLVDRANLGSASDGLVHTFYVDGAAESATGVTFRLAERNWWDFDVPQEIVYRGQCPWIFKGPECLYRGPEGDCNKLFSRCIELGNLEVSRGYPRMHPRQFGAEPAIPLLMR